MGGARNLHLSPGGPDLRVIWPRGVSPIGTSFWGFRYGPRPADAAAEMPSTRQSSLGRLIIAAAIAVAAATTTAALSLANRRDTEPTSPAMAEDVEAVRGRAQDRAAQSNLRNALVVAKVYFADNGGYVGFDAAAGRAIEPTLSWANDRPARKNRVSVNHSDASSVVLSTLSASGQAFCIRDVVLEGTSYGTVDAHGGRCRGSEVGMRLGPLGPLSAPRLIN